MRKIFFIIILSGFSICSFAQSSKRVIDTTAVNNWPSLSPFFKAISADGKYFMYLVENDPVGSRTMIICSTEGSWEMKFTGVASAIFSPDSREVVFQKADTLYFFSIKAGEFRKIPQAASYDKSPDGRWLACQLNNPAHELVLHDFSSGRDQRFDHVTEYLFDESSSRLLLKTETGDSLHTVSHLRWMVLSGGTVSEIWSGADHPGMTLTGYVIDHEGNQVCFTTRGQPGNTPVNRLWYYRSGMNSPEERAGSGTPGMDSSLFLIGYSYHLGFSDNGKYIFFGLSEKPLPKPSSDAVSIDVWSYRDTLLQETQLHQLHQGSPSEYVAVTPVNGSRTIRLEYSDDHINAGTKVAKSDYVIIRHTGQGDRFWLNQADSCYLISLKDGSRSLLKIKGYSDFAFSPDGRYLIYYDAGQEGNYFSYDLQTKKIKIISSGLPPRRLAYDDEFEYPRSKSPVVMPAGLAGWMPSDTALLAGDNYDLWELFLDGHKKPVNITRGYGRLHHIKLQTEQENGFFQPNAPLYNQGDSLLLVSFDTKNKYNGFYRAQLGVNKDPELLSMDPCTIWHYGLIAGFNPLDFNPGMPPLKAANTSTWVVQRNTATEAPNYFVTRDFKNYKPLTEMAPEKNYNWLTSELVSWIQPDGIASQGVLYKPENFDPKKKYPAIIYYYHQLSHRVYEYPNPEIMGSAHINIPWFVSRGYLVFTPDIYYHQYAFNQSACTTVESAGKMLSKLPYVDGIHLGIAGHSQGGMETNYIVTHSKLFAAALSGAAGHLGVDLISNSLAAQVDGANQLSRYEREDIGASLWQRRDLWIKNSPIFQANQVTTPFLIYYCKPDYDWLRAVEFFIALRRLNKRVWMLQYDHGDHSLEDKGDQKDFTTRITQFFDHYLKGTPAPVWMTQTIPAKLKGLKTGYELDTSGAKP